MSIDWRPIFVSSGSAALLTWCAIAAVSVVHRLCCLGLRLVGVAAGVNAFRVSRDRRAASLANFSGVALAISVWSIANAVR